MCNFFTVTEVRTCRGVDYVSYHVQLIGFLPLSWCIIRWLLNKSRTMKRTRVFTLLHMSSPLAFAKVDKSRSNELLRTPTLRSEVTLRSGAFSV